MFNATTNATTLTDLPSGSCFIIEIVSVNSFGNSSIIRGTDICTSKISDFRFIDSASSSALLIWDSILDFSFSRLIEPGSTLWRDIFAATSCNVSYLRKGFHRETSIRMWPMTDKFYPRSPQVISCCLAFQSLHHPISKLPTLQQLQYL